MNRNQSSVSSLQSLLQWLFQTQQSGISLGLAMVDRLLAALDHPEKKLCCLHIAGTNGKGSVAAMSESLLRHSGWRTGLYTSPHLVHFNERIRLAGVPVSEEILEEGISRLQWATRDWNQLPTFFELTTALAFDIFVQSKCEVVVLETGMGGRLDATNLASKSACALTPISLDHTEWLGKSLAAIAKEKAGIMRRGIPTVSAMQAPEVTEVLRAEAARIGAPLEIITTPISAEIPLSLVGGHQRWNAALALALVKQSGFSLSEEGQKKGLEEVSWPGRFQRLELEKSEEGAVFQEIILDGAHNIGAVEQLIATWKEEFPNQQCCLVFGSLIDKEGKAMLNLLKSIASEIVLVPVASPRSAAPAEMLSLVPEATVFSSLENFFETKKLRSSFFSKKVSMVKQKRSLDNPPILLTGSLFLVGEALAFFRGSQYRPSSQ